MKHLDDNLGALSLQLSVDAVRKLNELSAVDMGFYNEFVAQPHVANFLSGGTKVTRSTTFTAAQSEARAACPAAPRADAARRIRSGAAVSDNVSNWRITI